ncbi:ATP-binding cassette domain-containing protein [Actinoplanes derwentensis]|uniref:ABC-2 type transport system ATP-binding protein n=1 Tax=Actinoplanes derwentensis TaxID=113562 RepID=A0A1H2AM69_9ACTN|nr:ATP-binding cassette domain-containing protein [Actinoplanes derwentensis]GID89290.1 ABC transporter ATP-binding protein [Actinoplanes derwentensis]SDT47098.1 ABC-2 type transport system ATP-binding protein [Actinoplanes derwentensis]
MIEIKELTKTYGRMDAVRDVTFTAEPGRVTGLLGMNGSGKSTTLRILLGLTRATGGSALINGKRYRDLDRPLTHVGAVLEQGLSHPGQSGYAHLVTQSLLGGVGRDRVGALLEYVGLEDAATKRTGDYSLGMRQRLAVATALLGEPNVLVLDEPANGLDPPGMAWLREMLRAHADNGGTVLISSHLLAELEQVVDDVVIIGQGRILASAPLAELSGTARLRVRGSDQTRLAEAYEKAGATVVPANDLLIVSGLTPEEAGDLALAVQVAVYELMAETQHLEDVFLSVAEGR